MPDAPSAPPVPPAATAGDTEPTAGQHPELRVVPDAGAESSTRQRILDAAAHVLRTRGYNACRLSDIAKLCGTHQTAIYHYFRSKEALVDEVLRVGVTRTAETVQAAVEGLGDDTDPLERLATAIRAHLRMVLDSGDYPGATLRAPGELPPESQERLLRVQHDYGQYWSRLFADAQAGGYLRPGINLSVNRALVTGALNYALEWYDPAKGTVDELADELVPTFLVGLAAPEHTRDIDLRRFGRTPMPEPPGGDQT
jgi:AcrR family transcriptional regulator